VSTQRVVTANLWGYLAWFSWWMGLAVGTRWPEAGRPEIAGSRTEYVSPAVCVDCDSTAAVVAGVLLIARPASCARARSRVQARD
jgi:hypothetical protein